MQQNVNKKKNFFTYHHFTWTIKEKGESIVNLGRDLQESYTKQRQKAPCICLNVNPANICVM